MRGMRRLVRYRGLLLVNLALFLLFLVGLVLTGQQTYNADQVSHGEQPVGVFAYLGTSNFGEAVFENWESEFLQMGMYVVLTAYLLPTRLGGVEDRSRATRSMTRTRGCTRPIPTCRGRSARAAWC